MNGSFLVIRAAQTAALSRAAGSAFLGRMLRHVQEHFPAEAARIGPAALEQFVAGALDAGRKLGLTGSRHIAEQHGGQLLVETEQGVGSVFTLLLPAHIPVAPAEASPRKAQAVGAGAP